MMRIVPAPTAILVAVRRGERVTVTHGLQLTVCLLLALLSTLVGGEAAFAGSASASATDGSVFVNGIRAQDEIIAVNVRPVGSCCQADLLAERVRIESYVATDESGCRHWQSSSLEELTAADPTVSTVILVHGNRLTHADARNEGVRVYRRLVRQSMTDAPIRFVIFSWPSSQIRGPLRDVRVKAARTRPAGCQLAWLVDQMPAETPLTMVGFSYGARIITGALHVIGGGSLGMCQAAQLQHSGRAPVNAVLIASALNSDWLCPGHFHGQAMSQVGQMLLVNNSQDRAMRYYFFSTTNGRPQALGLCGPTCIDAAGASKIIQRNVARYVGSNHELFRYLSAPGVMGQIAEYASMTYATH
jgi:hypothetical protein